MLRSLASSSGWLVAAALLGLSSMATSLGGCATGAIEANGSDVGGGPGTGGAGGLTGGTAGRGGSGGTGGTTGGAGACDGASTSGVGIAFDPATPLSLERGKSESLPVKVCPPGVYTVRFALLPGPDSTLPGDASLNATDLPTDENGEVSVLLTAPSAPTTFQVRASTQDGSFATREVTVQKTGKAPLRVEALYGDPDVDDALEKLRPTSTWSAAATPDRPCSTLPGDDLDWTDSSTRTVELRDVPVGVQLAVFIRSERFVWGCATVPAVIEGMDNAVSIRVSNVPIALSQSSVTVSLDLDGFQSAFQSALEPSILSALAQVPGDADDVSTLLDAMQAESGSDDADFAAARTAGGWDAALRTLLGTSSATMLRDPLERWIRAGLANTSAGRFVGTLGAEGNDPERASLVLETVAGLPPDALGFSGENAATWYSSSPEDVVFFGSTLEVDPSLLLLGGALAPARTEVKGADTVAAALASVLSCDAVAAELVARGAATQMSYAGCDLDCAHSLCESALGAIVSDLEGREEDSPSSLELAASAGATVGADAELEGLTGTWVGTLECEGEPNDVGGDLQAPAP